MRVVTRTSWTNSRPQAGNSSAAGPRTSVAGQGANASTSTPADGHAGRKQPRRPASAARSAADPATAPRQWQRQAARQCDLPAHRFRERIGPRGQQPGYPRVSVLAQALACLYPVWFLVTAHLPTFVHRPGGRRPVIMYTSKLVPIVHRPQGRPLRTGDTRAKEASELKRLALACVLG